MLGVLKSVQKNVLSGNLAADLHGVPRPTLKDRSSVWVKLIRGQVWTQAILECSLMVGFLRRNISHQPLLMPSTFECTFLLKVLVDYTLMSRLVFPNSMSAA